MFISDVNYIGVKLFGSVTDTADNFITGVNDTGDWSLSWFTAISSVFDTGNKFITSVDDTADQLSPVTATPAINLSLVSMTLLNNDGGDNNTCDKFFAGVNDNCEHFPQVSLIPVRYIQKA